MDQKTYRQIHRSRTHEHVRGDLLLCLKCNLYKNEDEFDINNDKAYRKERDTRCKECKYNQHLKRREANRGKKDLDRLLLERWHGVKDRAKRTGYIVDFDWTYLKELWIKQNGMCAISGIEMTYAMNNGRTPTNLSVDKKRCKDGYSKDNIQLVCMAINQMKSDLSKQDFLFFCRAVVKLYGA